MALALELN
jgi:hypothetical protein